VNAGRRLALGAACVLMLAVARPAAAQPREALGGWAVDLRGAMVGLPNTAGWVPTAPNGTLIPGRGFGGDAAIDVFVGPGQHRRLSFGARGTFVQGRSTTATTSLTLTSRLFAAAPHVALNFGHRQGWSYLAIGAGQARVTSNAPGTAEDPGGQGLVIHYGGGARWFVSRRLAVSMDLRFWALTPRPANAVRQRAAAATKVAFSAGIALR
jgi:hypothetical protein